MLHAVGKRFGRGRVAVTALDSVSLSFLAGPREASSGVMGVHVGATITVYLPDGSPCRARVSAVYQRSLALGDLLIPASVADGHTGAPAGYSQILIGGGSERELAALAAAHPGVRLVSRSVYNTELAQNTGQNSFGDNVILRVIGALAAVTMINTLAVSTTERRRQVRLLIRIGATTRQLAGAFCWQALFMTVAGIAAGEAVCAGTLIGLDRAVTGTTVPYIQAAPAALIAAAVAALTFGTILTFFAAISSQAG